MLKEAIIIARCQILRKLVPVAWFRAKSVHTKARARARGPFRLRGVQEGVHVYAGRLWHGHALRNRNPL